MAGNQRWDLRVTITFRDPSAAVVVGGAFDKASEAVKARLYADKKKFDAEEATRPGPSADHWQWQDRRRALSSTAVEAG